jgi:hypothetical protein
VLLALQVTDTDRTAQQTDDSVASVISAFIAAAGEHEGQLHDYGAGRIIVGWGPGGPERDDVLRACLAGLEIAAKQHSAGDATTSPTTPPTAFLLIDYMADAPVGQTMSELASVLGRVNR